MSDPTDLRGRRIYAGLVRTAGTRALGSLAAAAWFLAAAPASHAEVDTYAFEGVIATVDLGILFGGKMVGQTFSGTFTIDSGAMLTFVGGGGQATNWKGGFEVVVEGIAYPVDVFTVFSGSSLYEQGFLFQFSAGNESAALSMRSSSHIYDQPLLPTSVILADMDLESLVIVSVFEPAFASDQGEITFLPEVGPTALATVAAGTLATLRSRRRSRWQRVPLLGLDGRSPCRRHPDRSVRTAIRKRCVSAGPCPAARRARAQRWPSARRVGAPRAARAAPPRGRDCPTCASTCATASCANPRAPR